MPESIAFSANTPIALLDRPVFSEIAANSTAISPENATDVPNILFNSILALTTSLDDTNKSPDIAAASAISAFILAPSAAEIPIDFAVSPAALSICMNALTASIISPTGPKALVNIGPKALAPAFMAIIALDPPLIPFITLEAALPVNFPNFLSKPNCLIFSFVKPLPPDCAASCMLAAMLLADSPASSIGPENFERPGIAFVISAIPPKDLTPKLPLISFEFLATVSKSFFNLPAALT